MKVFHRIFSILLIAGMMLGWTTSGSILASASQPAGSQVNASSKFEALVLEQLKAGPADFIIMMSEQADVSAADRMQTKTEKGQYVFDTLVETAARTQASLRAYLDSQHANYQSFYIVNAIWVKQGSFNMAQTIAARPDVAAITANHTYHIDEPINPVTSTAQPQDVEPNISFVKADQVWALGITGQGMVVADDDTGLDNTHPAIARHYRGCIDPPACTTWDHNYNWFDAWGDSPSVPWDDYGHGTHTAGTMVGDDGAGNQIGMAPGAKLISCKNMEGGGGDDAHFIICFQWNLAPTDTSGNNPRPDLAPDSINNSWGYFGGGVNSFRSVIDNLLAAGIVVEVSAGNEGSGCQTLRSPGDYQEVFTTGSVNHAYAYPGLLTGFSSRGPSSLDGNYFPDFMAPGEHVRSSLPGNQYAYWDGTSMAGPHVTALISLIWAANPALRGQIEATYNIIRDTVTPLVGQGGSNCGGDYTVGPNNDWGYGTIDALSAVQLAIAMGGAGKLHGTVTDADTGDPVEGVNILAQHEAGYTWDINTNASGYYTMTVAVGTYTVTASADGYLSQMAYPVEVITDEVTTQNFVLNYIPNVSITPEAQTQIGEPGMQVNYVYTVTNDAHVDQEIQLNLESIWPTEAPTSTGILAPEASTTIPVMVTIPYVPNVIIGTDTFTMTAVGSVGGTFIATGTTKANVTPGVKVAGPEDDSGMPLEVISYQFVVTNTGNYTDSYALSAFGLWSSTLPGGNNTGPLPAGAKTTVTVLVAIPAGVADGDKCITSFRATSDLSHSVRASAHVTTTAVVKYYTILPIVLK